MAPTDAMINVIEVIAGLVLMFLLMNCHVFVVPKLHCHPFNVEQSLLHVTNPVLGIINAVIQSGIHVIAIHNVLPVRN